MNTGTGEPCLRPAGRHGAPAEIEERHVAGIDRPSDAGLNDNGGITGRAGNEREDREAKRDRGAAGDLENPRARRCRPDRTTAAADEEPRNRAGRPPPAEQLETPETGDGAARITAAEGRAPVAGEEESQRPAKSENEGRGKEAARGNSHQPSQQKPVQAAPAQATAGGRSGFEEEPRGAGIRVGFMSCHHVSCLVSG